MALGIRPFFLEHSLRSACTCAHCTFVFMRNNYLSWWETKYYICIQCVYLFINKQTDIQKNDKTTTTTTTDMYTNCNRKTQQCILHVYQCPCIYSQKGFFKPQTRMYSCNHWILKDGVCVINLISPCFSILCLSFCECFMDRFFFTHFLSFRQSWFSRIWPLQNS